MSIVPLSVHQLSKAYGARRVLDSVSLALQPGEIFGLIGLNGIGKTTLIKAVLGLIDADAGSAQVFGVPSSSVEGRARLCYLPERFQPSRYLKGNEYLALALSYYGQKLEWARAEQEAHLLHLDPAALRMRVGAYSKGMGQKLGLMGAFLAGTELLLLDEPMSGLDPAARIRLKERLLHAKAEGKTVFFSSHILADIDEICDRIGVLYATRLTFTGTPEAFKAAQNATSLERAFLCAIEA